MFSEKIKRILIDEDLSILEAIKLMDKLGCKSLIVFDSFKKFKSILSIGDVQRAILKNKSLETQIKDILRTKINVAKVGESQSDIKKKMFEFRTECMPIIDMDNNLVDVLFWEEEFNVKIRNQNSLINIPVVIMAGGLGSRLKPLTNIIPKPLIPIGEKPIIEIIVDDFNELGVEEFYFSVNYKAEMIKYYFDNVEKKNYKIDSFQESMPLGTAGSLFLLKDKIKSTFFVSNCDILITQDYSEIYNYHKEHGNDITLVGSLKHLKIPYGILETGEDGKLLEMKEKPELTYLINSGMYILEPKVLENIPENTFLHITDLIESYRKNGGKVGVFPVSEKSWFDIGEWDQYQETIKNYKSH